MEYELKFITKEYIHGWTLWIQCNNQKFQLASAVKSKREIESLIENIRMHSEPLSDKAKLEIALNRIEKLEREIETFKLTLNDTSRSTSIGYF